MVGDVLKPLSEETCAKCGKPIDAQPGQTFTASTDGKVWHYGCSPSRSARTPSPQVELREVLERVEHAVNERIEWDGGQSGVDLQIGDVQILLAALSPQDEVIGGTTDG